MPKFTRGPQKSDIEFASVAIAYVIAWLRTGR